MQTSGCSLDDEIKRGGWGETGGKGQERRWRWGVEGEMR